MNVSGPAVATAWRAYLKELPNDDRVHAKLVVVHDELESPLGKIRVRHGGSAKGHNGLKSVNRSLGGPNYARIGIGIGRPESRESKDVATYVLRKMSSIEFQKISDEAETVFSNLVAMRDQQI